MSQGWTNHMEKVRRLERENKILKERCEGLVEALRKLSNEVTGIAFAEQEIIAVISLTNWRALMLRRDEARTALAAAEEGGGE